MGNKRKVAATAVALATLAMTGCGNGTKLLKEPKPIPEVVPLAVAGDSQIEASLDWVIVRDGPGTWARNADWDEYLITVRNLTDKNVRIMSVDVVDLMNVRIATTSDRNELVKESKEVAKRYEDYDLDVKAGAGAGSMLGTGLVTAAAVPSVAMAAAFGSTAAAAAAVTSIVAAPVLITGGVIRGVNNEKVSREIESRGSELPLLIRSGESIQAVVFFPFAPSPQQVEIAYRVAIKDELLAIDTRESLSGLHLTDAD